MGEPTWNDIDPLLWMVFVVVLVVGAMCLVGGQPS